jgi:plasmid maintenance system antidote protein VapI
MIQHHGEYLSKLLRTRSINITDFAKKMSISRETVYNWFETQYLSEEKWNQIGEVLGDDFINEVYPKRGKYAVEKEVPKSSEEVTSYLSNRISVSIDLNGDESLLESMIKKLRKINEVLKNV